MLCWLRARAGRWFRGPNGEKLLAREVLVDHGPGEAHTGKEEGRERWVNRAAGERKKKNGLRAGPRGLGFCVYFPFLFLFSLSSISNQKQLIEFKLI